MIHDRQHFSRDTHPSASGVKIIHRSIGGVFQPRDQIMPNITHIHLDEYPYMTTTVTVNRKPIFNNETAANILLEAIWFGKRQNWYHILSFTIMYDHMHLIIVPRDKNISECMKSIKGYSARKINSTIGGRGSIWQRGFYDYILDSEEKILSRISYIEENPVRKGIVENAEDYEYSSARFREEMDIEILS
jgi:putative transposase